MKNGKIIEDNNVEEDSENLSNVSDDELNHNTKIDETLQKIDPTQEMRRNFGNAISSIKGVSQKRSSILPPNTNLSSQRPSMIKLGDVKNKVLQEQYIDEDIDENYKMA